MSATKTLLEQVEESFDDIAYFEPKKCNTCTRTLITNQSKQCGQCVSCRGSNSETLSSRQLQTMDYDLQVRRNPNI